MNPWFRIDPIAQQVLEACDELSLKIPDRIKDKKELREVAACFEPLAIYLYSVIPEISSNEEISREGQKQLLVFSERVQGLSLYSSEPESASGKLNVLRRAANMVHALTASFSHQNLIICFVAWYLLANVLVLGSAAMAMRMIPRLAIDSVLLTTLIGVPILSALPAAITASRRTQLKKSDE